MTLRVTRALERALRSILCVCGGILGAVRIDDSVVAFDGSDLLSTTYKRRVEKKGLSAAAVFSSFLECFHSSEIKHRSDAEGTLKGKIGLSTAWA
jgi:hypothetical protein